MPDTPNDSAVVLARFGPDPRDESLPCDSCPHSEPISTRLRRLEDFATRTDTALFGNGKRPGMVEQVELIVDLLKIGKSTGRVFIWMGGAAIAIAAAYTTLKSALFGVVVPH